MIEAQGASEILSANKKKNLAINTQADAPIRFSQLSKTNDLASAGDIFELGKSPQKIRGISKKYSRLRCLLRVKGLVIYFYLGWAGSILQ